MRQLMLEKWANERFFYERATDSGDATFSQSTPSPKYMIQQDQKMRHTYSIIYSSNFVQWKPTGCNAWQTQAMPRVHALKLPQSGKDTTPKDQT